MVSKLLDKSHMPDPLPKHFAGEESGKLHIPISYSGVYSWLYFLLGGGGGGGGGLWFSMQPYSNA